MNKKDRIAILTTVANFELYKKTSRFFPSSIKKYVIDGSNGMHGIHSIVYMMFKLKDEDIEWLIMADEDVIFVDSDYVFKIIEDMQTNNITVAGVRDGGVVTHRKKNPYAINTFFSILNLKEILRIWNKKEVLKNQYIYDNEFDDDLSRLKGSFDKKSLFEPYYCFYFWLRRQGKKILFLDAKMNEDGITNEVYYKADKLLYHTWYARSYGINKKHTERINKILVGAENTKQEAEYINPICFRDSMFYLKKVIRKYYKYLLLKLGR
ncbi:hypothetical protein U0L90_11270 [Flavobacteriaceae sp. LMIT009]